MPKKKIVKRKSKSLKPKSSGTIKSYAPSGVDLDLDQLYDIIDELEIEEYDNCLLYTSPSPRDKRQSRMPSSA